MIPELGHFALILAFCCSVVLSLVPLAGTWLSRPAWVALARPAALVQGFFLLLAYLALTTSFIQHDFSVAYVANHSNLSLPLIYRIAGVWGGHEGSVLFWVVILGFWTAAVALMSGHIPQILKARVLSVLGMVAAGFLLFVLMTSNPFERLVPMPPDGASLNPLLQDPGMAAHPPLLYMGYVGLAVAFAFAIAALIGGQLDSATLRWMRPWTNVAWMFLTLGIALGSYWAYYELGWGGWWFWDPVENASFMPWLVGTALIHSLAASEKRSVFKAWTVLLAVLAFSLSLLGTFLVRSGVLTSVHAFATDPTRGLFILMFLCVVVGGSLALFAFRAQHLRTDVSFSLVSRESGLLFNNVLMVVASAAVLIGTLYPLAFDALGLGKLSVGPQYFNAVFVPLMLPVLALVGIGAQLNWKRDKLGRRGRTWLLMLAASLVAGIALSVAMAEGYRWQSALALVLAVWILLTSLQGVWHRLRHKRERFSAALHTPAAFWGMTLAHIGIAVFAVGATLVTQHAHEETVRMAPGESHQVGEYTFTLSEIREVRGPNYGAAQAVVAVSRDARPVASLLADKRIYDARSDTMTEAGIDGGLTRDLFVALGEPLAGGREWAVRLQVKPFVRWIWLGCILMAVGALLAAVDRRYRVKQRAAERAEAHPGASDGSAAIGAAVASGAGSAGN